MMTLLKDRSLELSRLSEVSITKNLIGWWPLDDSTRSLISPSKDGTLEGTTKEIVSPVGKGMDFDGTATAIVMGADSSMDVDEVSISAWVMLRSLDNWKRIFMRGEHNNYQLDISPTTNTFRMEIWTTMEEQVRCYSTTPIQYNVWYHVVATAGKGIQKIYIDGQLENSTPYQGTILRDVSALSKIGDDVRSNHSTTFIDGLLADIRVYDGDLNKSDVKVLYDGSKRKSRGDVKYQNEMTYVSRYLEIN